MIHFSKPTECTTPRVNSNGNYGLWGMETCQCGFLSCNKCPPLVGGMLRAGKAVQVRGQEVYGTSLYLPLKSALNLKLL